MFTLPLRLQKSIVIEKPVEELFKLVGDFHTWARWSPWLVQEPEAKTTITGTPGKLRHGQSWEGKFIGAGNLELKLLQPNQLLRFDLNFLKPWKSHSTTDFRFEKQGAATRVTWSMDGTLPAFLFFMKRMMVAYVGSDYDRGLLMLKELAEKGSVLTTVNVRGVVDKNGFFYMGKKNKCTVKELGASMQKDFLSLQGAADAVGDPLFNFSFYHQFDLVKGVVEYTAGLAYPETLEGRAPAGLNTGKVEDHKALEVDHHGPYHHLGNAWSTAMGRQRFMKLKPAKAIPMYEIYKTMPGKVAEDKIVTEIYMPIK